MLGGAGSPGAIRPKKECIKSCETCFANTLNLNDKGPSLKWVCFPKSYSTLANWPWLRISPQSSLFVVYCLILTAWQWLMSFTCIAAQTEANKSPLRKRLLAFLLWETRQVSSPSRSCLGKLILIRGGPAGVGDPSDRAHPPHHSIFLTFSSLQRISSWSFDEIFPITTFLMFLNVSLASQLKGQ